MLLVCIAGGTCSGKTTLARKTCEALGERCELMPLDNYYRASELPSVERAALNHDLPSAYDWQLLGAHLRAMAGGESVAMPIYDYSIHNRTEKTMLLEPPDVLLLEGLYALYDEEVLAMAAHSIFLDSTREERRERRLGRDLAERGSEPVYAAGKFDELAEPAYLEHVRPTSSRADLVANGVEEAYCYLMKRLADYSLG